MENLNTLFTQTIGLTDEHFNSFKQLMYCKKLDRKDWLIRQGTVCNFIGFVLSGTLRSYIEAEEEEFNNDFYFDGSIVTAYTSFLTQQPTNCNIQALSMAQIVYITDEQYNMLLKADNEWLKLGKYISESFFIRKCKRETSFLKKSAIGKLQNVLSIYPGIEQKVSQYHIASYMGIQPESLSRLKTLNLHQ